MTIDRTLVRCVLIAGALVAATVLLSSRGGLFDTWSRNHWNVDLLKVALHSLSVGSGLDRSVLERLEQMRNDRQSEAPRSLFYLGRVYEALGEPRAAINYYESAFLSPDIANLDLSFRIMLSNRLGHLLFKQRLYSKAIPLLRNGIVLLEQSDPAYAPEAVQMYWDLAESIYVYEGDKAAYEKWMLRAIRLRPSDMGLIEALMERYLGWNDMDRAHELAKRWSLAAPGSSRPVFYMGRIRQLQGNCGEAQIFYMEAIVIEPQYFLSHFWLAFCHNQLDELGPAITEFKRAIMLAPSEWWIYRHLGNTLIKKGRFTEAQDVLIKGLSLNPQDGWTQQLLEEARQRNR